MGMYTELVMSCRLKKDIPDIILKSIEKIIGKKDHEEYDNIYGYDYYCLLSGGSYYFPRANVNCLRFDDIAEEWHMSIRTNLKDYEDEIQTFIRWLMPYIDSGSGHYGDFLGYIMYEEDIHPTMIYMNERPYD